MKQVEQLFYDMSFNDTENLSSLVIFEAQRMGFMQGIGTSDITLAPIALVFEGVSPVLPDVAQYPAP
nr:hypothetical protein CFP56_69314 [Quercus suber]